MRKLAKVVKTNFFSVLEINQSLTTFPGTFILRKTNWVSVRAVNFCGYYPSPFFSSQICSSLENQQFHNHNSQEKQQFSCVWRGKEGLVLPKMSLFDLLEVTWKSPLAELVFIWPDSALAAWIAFSLGDFCQKNKKKRKKVNSNNLT